MCVPLSNGVACPRSGNERGALGVVGRVFQTRVAARAVRPAQGSARSGWGCGGGARYGLVSFSGMEVTPLISDDVRRERNREAATKHRRAAGSVPRAEYEAHAAARLEKARELQAQGLSIRKIAAEMGISKTQVQRYVSEVSHVCPVI